MVSFIRGKFSIRELSALPCQENLWFHVTIFPHLFLVVFSELSALSLVVNIF